MSRLVSRVVGVLAGLGLAAPAIAQPPAAPSALTGSISLGVRSVDVSGTTAKYLQDVNLDDGVRLFGVQMSYEPTQAGGTIDRFDLDATGLGGDPFESIHLGLRKFGAYNLKLDRRRSEYFYADTILPADLASIAGSTGGDYHRFDFERVRDSAALDIDLSPATGISVSLERQTRAGKSTTTQDIQRDEFELDRPLDESSNALTLGVHHAWQRVTLIFEERLQDFANTSVLFLPGASPGANTTDPAALDFFMLDQSYDYKSRSRLVRAVTRPTDRVDVSAFWQHEALDLDVPAASESSGGVAFDGTPFTTTASGAAAVGRDVDVGGIEVGAKVGERLRLVGSARHSKLAQSGALAYATDLGSGDWDIATDGVELGVEVAVTPVMTVAAGWSAESRDTTRGFTLNTEVSGPDVSNTDRQGFFVRLAVETPGKIDVNLGIESNDIDDPFALASPTATRRYKISARRRWENGLSLAGTYRSSSVDNRRSGFGSGTEQADLRLMYRGSRVQLSTGYARINLARQIDQLVTGGTRQDLFAIDYAAAALLRDASARWQVNPRVALGADLRAYDNHGSFRLARNDNSAYVDLAVGAAYGLKVAFRDLDYTEDAFDAYDAQIVEVAFALRWQ
jgi:hypothetical protein